MYNIPDDQDELLEMVVRDIQVGQLLPQGYQPIKLETSRGNIEFRYYPASGAKRGAIWVGGVGGGWDTPANGLYPQLCQELTSEGIASLRVRYRHPTILEESVLDVLTGITFLESEGIEAVGLTGHSFGGAVVIQAAAISGAVRTVVTLATQSYGATPVSQLAPDCEILLIHGTVDRLLTPACSEYVYKIAHEPKQIILYQGANHGLNEVAEEVHQVVQKWMVDKLNRVLHS